MVIGLIYLNQVLFTVYVLREHDRDPSFIARHVPDGWFTLAHGSVLESLARHFPVPELALSGTITRDGTPTTGAVLVGDTMVVFNAADLPDPEAVLAVLGPIDPGEQIQHVP